MTASPPPESVAQRRLRRLWLAGLVGGLSVVLACTLIIIVRGREPGETLGMVLGSAAFLPIYGLLGIIAVRAMRYGASALFMVAAQLSLVAALVVWMTLGWVAIGGADVDGLFGWFRVAGTLAIVGAGFTLLGAATTAQRRGPVIVALRRITVVSGSVTALCGLGLMWSPLARRFVEVPLILGGVAGVTLLGGAAATLIAYRLLAIKDRRRRESLPAALTLRITCPRCGDEADRPTGASRCNQCDHVLLIDVHEPRCECGYLIYRLDQEQCPECGRALG